MTVEELAYELRGKQGKEIILVEVASSIDPANPRRTLHTYNYYHTSNLDDAISTLKCVLTDLKRKRG